VLRQVEQEGGFANHLLEMAFNRTGLSPEDRRLAYLLVYGVLRHRNRLDWAISSHADHPLGKLTPWIRNCLRMGAYQLLDIRDLRPSVAVDESVRLAHRYGHRGTASFVNAVLRKIASQGVRSLPTMSESPEEHLVIAQSHPRWLVNRWLKRYGPDITLKLCVVNNQPPRTTIRWNRLKGGFLDQPPELLGKSLEEPVPSDVIPEAFFIQGPQPIVHHPLYQEGKIDIMGLSSMLISHLLDVTGGHKVLDVCSGSGGKSCHMADLMENQGVIISADLKKGKLKAFLKRSRRLGAGICHPLCCDSARDLPLKEAFFDRVLVDAPCSSLGVIQRHPEIRWLRSEADILSLARIQKDILIRAAKALRKGGRLLYGTCSLEPEETEDVMREFLERFPGFKVIDMNDGIPNAWQYKWKGDGALRLFPFSSGTDGFFAFSVRK